MFEHLSVNPKQHAGRAVRLLGPRTSLITPSLLQQLLGKLCLNWCGIHRVRQGPRVRMTSYGWHEKGTEILPVPKYRCGSAARNQSLVASVYRRSIGANAVGGE